MNRKLILILLSAVVLTLSGAQNQAFGQAAAPPVAPSPPSQPPGTDHAVTDVTVFYDGLAPYGDWLKVKEYGWVWRPHGVAIDWRPYTNGHWIFADQYGWMWAADEPWGWAPYHYGRWYWEGDYGWCWVPGSVWAPAWVSWRRGGGCIGWCPLPPAVGWREDIGLDFGGVRLDLIESVHPCWSFVDERFIAEPSLHEHIIVAARNTTLIERTKEITKFKEEDGRIVNESLSVRRVERITGRTVERVHVREVETAREVRVPQPGDREVTMFRKRINENERITPQGESIDRNVNTVDVEKRQERELADLKTRQETERRSLEEHQKREINDPPGGTTVEDLQKQHEVERHMQQEQHQRDIDIQKRWHERERERIHNRR